METPVTPTSKKTITLGEKPVTIGYPMTNIDDNAFDVLVDQKGLDVIWEKAVRCPCKEPAVSSHLSTCKNCAGIGWIFVSPIKTKMVMQSMNLRNDRKEWSIELVGMAGVTPLSGISLSYMDRITIIESRGTYGEVLSAKRIDNRILAHLMYPIHEVESAYILISAGEKLVKLVADDYTIVGNTFQLLKEWKEDIASITLRYIHQVQYHIEDISRHIRNMDIDISGASDPTARRKGMMPIYAMARIAHMSLDNINYAGLVNVFDNS